MPELPDVEAYVEALRERVVGRPLERLRIASAFLLRTVDPPVAELEGRDVVGVTRLGKRIVWELAEERFAVLHLMISGRLHWKPRGASLARKVDLAAFDVPDGSVTLTEAGTQKRASLHLVRGRAGLAAHDRGGVEPLDATPEAFRAALERESHTVKRALTDPRILSGIGNAYSDEILHRARLSPFKNTRKLDDDEHRRLHQATRDVLVEWTERLRRERGDRFPEKVTAFRPEMAVHGRYRQPCPVCGAPVQRIVYAGNEANYCPRCQTEGRILADRALSRLLKGDWPRTLEELESATAR